MPRFQNKEISVVSEMLHLDIQKKLGGHICLD